MTAYLVLFIDGTKKPPIVSGASISSSNALGMTQRPDPANVPVDVFSVECSNFDDGVRIVKRHVAEAPQYSWLTRML